MFKKFLYGIVAMTALFHAINAQAQDTSKYHREFPCKLSTAFIQSMVVDSPRHGATALMIPPAAFPPAAIDTCGRFQVFYADLAIFIATGTRGGFADLTTGATRRNTMCAVLNYIQSRIDFSKLHDTEYVRLYIDTSCSAAFPASGTTLGILALAAPFHAPLASSTNINGFVHDFVTTGTDPNIGDYHGYLKMNFDKAYLSGSGVPDDIIFNNGLGDPLCNEFDAYSVFLHFITHTIGWFSFSDSYHTGLSSISNYSNFDLSIHKTPWMRLATNPFAGIIKVFPTSPVFAADYWVNGKLPPDNYPVSTFSHIDAGYYLNRVSPGEVANYVMMGSIIYGNKNREYTKGDWETLHNSIGYDYNSTFAADSAVVIGNHLPYSQKMGSDSLNRLFVFYFKENMPEYIPADYSLKNDVGASITINLNSLSDLIDADGDTISVYPNSLINYRGCGNGGNNHKQLTLSNSNKTITYTPRPNFYGKAQFSANLYDGKQKGGLVVFTIDVTKGNNVSIATGSNLALNGDFEEGSEIRTNDTNQHIPNGVMQRAELSQHQSDSHPYDYSNVHFGTAIRNAVKICTTTPYRLYSFGHDWCTLDYTAPFFGGTYTAPNPVAGIGNRYQPIAIRPVNFYLGDTLKHCQRYQLEFDAIRTLSPASIVSYPKYDSIIIGFGADTFFSSSITPSPIVSMKPYKTDSIALGTWHHFKIPFSYCRNTTANIMSLYIKGLNGFAPPQMIDNVILKEIEDPIVFTLKDSAIGRCSRRLYADFYDLGCSIYTYQWRKLGDPTVLATTATFDISNPVQSAYTLTLSDGCSSNIDTINIAPCPCSVGAVFGATKDSVLPATTATSLIAGVYHLTADMTVTGSPTFTNALILIEPDVQITVANNAKLTLDNCHLLTCPDTNKLWKGISLASTGSAAGGTSAKIEVKNNTLLEDAYTAIDANYIKAPASGDIISVTNSIFNRNGTDININNGYALAAAGKYPITLTGNLFTARLFHDSSMTGYPATWASVFSLKALTTPNDATPNYFVSKKYPKAYRKDSVFSYLCVQVQNVGTTFGGGSSFGEVEIGGGSAVGDLNLYDNHRYGIHSNNTNATVYNSAFIHISKRMYPSPLPHSSTLPDWGGGGIVARTSTPTLINRVNIVQTLGGNLGNRFFDCWGAIYVERLAYLTVSDVEITSSHRLGLPTPGAAYPSEIYRGTGIELRDSAGLVKWTINSNSISNVNAGIYAYLQNPKAGAVTNIKFNKFYAANPNTTFAPYTTDQYQLQGIEVYSPTAAAKNNLYADSNTMTKVFNGIYCNGLRFTKASVQYNNINLWDVTMSTPNPQFGIKMETCTDALVSSDSISTPTLGAVLYADRMNGVYAAFNTSLSVCNNSTNKIGRGFSFDQKTAQIGTRWILNTMNDGYKGFVLGSDIGDQGFMYNWATMSPLTFYGATGNKWTGFGGVKYQTVGLDYTNTLLSKLYVKNITTGTAEKPTFNFAIPVPTNPNKYFDSLAYGSILPPTFTNLGDANCIGSIMPTKTKYIPLGGIKKSLAFLILSDSTGYGTDYRPNQWMAQMALYELCTLDPEMRDSISTLDSFMVAAANSRFAWLTNIETALANGNNSQAQALLNNPVQAMGRVVISPDVIITDYTEANNVVNHYKDYYAVYLKHLTNSMNATDTAAIAALAAKCPAKDGAAVYKARGLYRSLTGIVGAYNDDGCLYGNGGQYRLAPLSNEANLSDYVLYPNPNNGSFVITSTSLRGTKQSEAIPVKVYNALGMLVYQKNLSFTNGELSVNLGQASHGVYLVCIENGRDKPTCLRFIIQ